MSNWKIYTPEGVQDILFNECFAKKNVETSIRELFRAWGYMEVETPSIEFFDVFSDEEGKSAQESMFKFFDGQGRILVLRPDLTIPIARLAATKLKDTKNGQRVFYIGNTFRYNTTGGGRQKEFTQAGVELLGYSTPLADAEAITTAINAMLEAGLENFQIDIGQVEFFRGLMEETGLSSIEIEQMRSLIDSKDYLGVEELVKSHNIKQELKELILNLPGLFGNVDVIDKVEKLSLNEKSVAALENLRSVLEILSDYGLSKYVSVDLGMVQGLDYYTGIIFRGYTYGVGFPIVSGGRYDKLMDRFGKNCSATGFSLGINFLMSALDRQKIESKKPSIDTLVIAEKEGRKSSITICKALRDQGMSVEVYLGNDSFDSACKYALSKNIGGVIRVVDEDRIEMKNLASNEVIKTSISELIKRH